MERRFTTGDDTHFFDFILPSSLPARVAAVRRWLGRAARALWKDYQQSLDMMHRCRFRWPPFY